MSLSDILSGKTDDTLNLEKENTLLEKPLIQGYCIECEDQPASLHCEQCTDDFCQVCFASQHRKGTRKSHTTRKLLQYNHTNERQNENRDSNAVSGTEMDEEYESTHHVQETELVGESVGTWFVERSKFIPLRLDFEERKFLRLLEAALHVSEYTDKIDVIVYSSKTRRIVAQIKELCAIISGLVMASDYQLGQELFQDRNFAQNQVFFSQIFELGRRHKIMNPEKMRDTYGKLMYLLQDAQMPEVQELLEFSCVSPLKTVYSVLESKNALHILMDDSISIATKEIISEGRSRYEIQSDIKAKERAIERLAKKYSTRDLAPELIKQCLYSIGDNHAFLRVNRDPCDTMISYLKKYFHPTEYAPEYSLSIQAGRGGARISHDHEKQYNYVLQSLSLWREIQHEMFMLWGLAEQDLLFPDNYYRLRDTGQGLNRVQAAPKVSRLMHTILHRAQQKVGYWIGSSVIHLGDHNVPNALMFIDKYTQIFHILLPICTCLQQIDSLVKNPDLQDLIDSSFGGPETLKKDILVDFFRHAFDGSGADNYFDAGSCIDGRLTSAWNWCSKMEKKAYFPIFLLSGFTGFDGKF